MKKKKISFSILGLGRVIEKRIYEMFKSEIKNGFVQIVFDKDKKKTKKYSTLFNCKKANSLEEFLNVKTDYVYIATESGNHFMHIKKCLLNYKNVIVEKPPVLKVEQLQLLEKIAKSKKVNFYSIFQNRLNKSVQFVKKNIDKERVIFVNLSLVWSRPQSYYNDWHGKWKLDGGVLAQQGIHYIDILVYLFGKSKKCISNIDNKVNKLQAEDTHSALIIFEKKNLSCTVNMSTSFRPKDHKASIEIYCKDKAITLGGLCCNEISVIEFKRGIKKRSDKIEKYSENVPSGYGISHRKEFQNLIDFELQKKKKKPLKAIDTIETIKLINMMYKSYFDKRWIYSNEKKINSKLGS